MDLVWPATAWALWVATLAAAFKLSSRGRAVRAPELPAPPPVAELLRGMRAQEVFHAALFDLAERGWVTIEGDRLSLVDLPEEPRSQGTEELPAYERWVLARVTALLSGAPHAPVTALMPEGADLERGFLPLVRESAIDLGLARRRWPTLIVPVLLAAALAVPWYATVSAAGLSWPGMIATMVSLVAGPGLLLAGRGFVPTARGRQVAGSGPAPADPRHEWIYTGSGWPGVEIEPAATPGPGRREVAGHVVKRWVEGTPAEPYQGVKEDAGASPGYYIALHDGRSPAATAFSVEPGLYRDVLPGDSVRLLVRPRSGAVVRVLAHERHW
ncbi:hypothetical protein [Nonomuraea jiangxiensis]|uniref:Uncharacterized protein n=1 Tax=Nonomuraea jiangxiensis TaxID=633440 RepID=A0A1G8G1I0_9ACTN|nr:hypothetical protein [Nonomuraea jiangxiensis]SDH88254.1 hypothetical protein SAMN05421869_103503 [Nonomuraea jiangxiensis]